MTLYTDELREKAAQAAFVVFRDNQSFHDFPDDWDEMSSIDQETFRMIADAVVDNV